ncbi:MAG: J domain-containing protein [Syntrophobacterales bacterium]|nr:J domain-containing protein [Syntrophobacterales bacterium]
MYMRRVRYGNAYHYVIRESYRKGDTWTYRDLVDLGENPESYIHYVGGNGFYFDETLEEKLEEAGVTFSSEDLEALFFPFIDPNIRRIILNFQHDFRRHRFSSDIPTSDSELFEKQKQLHGFDKRRMHFLRCGRVDTGKLEERSWKFLNILLDKSRDERETIIEEMERHLRPREIKSYVYTAFDLQRYFEDSFVKNNPIALDPERVDEAFFDAICRLNKDSMFFDGVPDYEPEVLHPYLRKYLIIYFDATFEPLFSWDEFIRGIFGAKERSAYRRWASRSNMSILEACKKLGIDPSRWKELSTKEITSVYRRQAKTLHPDAGGDHEAFIKLTEAYRALIAFKLRQT